MIRRGLVSFALLLVAAAVACAQPLLEGVPTPGLVHVQPASTLQLLGSIQNFSADVIYLRGISYSPSATFAGTVSLSDFVHAKPDSLRPGERWQGPLARIVVPPGPGTNSQHRLDFTVSGGLNRYDSQVVAELTFVVDDSTIAVTGVDTQPVVPAVAMLEIAPNPGAGEARVRYALPRDGAVDLRILDLLGRTRRVLSSRRQAAGSYSLPWDGRDSAGARLAPGVYFARLITPDGILKRKLVRIE